jgi:raffinose/stachyose/melibiose transport system substrate-binding protein
MEGRRSHRYFRHAASVLCALCAAAFGIAGCGGDDDSSDGSPASKGGALAGELTMWDIPESDGYVAWWKDYIKRFERSHPEVTIKLQQFQSEPYKAKIQSAIVSGTTPDIFYAIPGPQYYSAFSGGRMVALDEWISPDRFVPAAREACTVDGKLACVPLYVAPSYVYYNEAMFEKAGVDPSSWEDPTQPTWEEFLAACDQLKRADLVPLGVGNGDKWPGLFYYWAIQNRFGGVQAFRDAISGDNGGSFSGPSFLKAGELTQELARRGYFEPGTNGIAGDQKYELFTQSRAAMMFMGPWLIGLIADGAPKDFRYGFFKFPSFPDGDPSSQQDLMAGVDALWLSANSKSPEAAGAFLKGFTETATQVDFDIKSQSVSSVQGVAEKAGKPNDPIIKMTKLSEKAPQAFPWWDAALPPKIANAMLNNSQALLAGKMSPADFANAMDEAAGR